MTEVNLPLSCYTVLDLTTARSGPTAVRQLADWGANVIKIEPPGEQDGDGGPLEKRHGADFQNLHRNKRSVTLNLKSPEGLEFFKRMVKKADVLVENYRPRVKYRLGIDYATLHEINPRLVYGSISGFGEHGPYRDRPGLDQVVQGLSGLMSITGLPGQGPVRAGIAVSDSSAGIYCAFGIVMALLQRERTGQGQWVQTSLLQAMIAMLDFQAARWLVNREVPQQAGNNHPTAIPTGIFRASDGYINIAATGQKHLRLFRAIGSPELIDHPDYKDFKLRSKNRDALHAAIGERIATRTCAEWIAILNEAGVPCGPIYSIDQTFADAQVRQLGMAQPVEHPVLGAVELVGQGLSIDGVPSIQYTAAPGRGQHTEEVLKEFGLDEQAIAELRERGAV